MTAELEISFLGGASAIGASCALARCGDTSVLIDCGVRFRGAERLPDLSVLSGRHVDAVLVTHAHSDHTGGLPVVHDAFPAAPIHATAPTIDLVQILLRDALKLMNAPDREGELPLYTEHQVTGALHAMLPVTPRSPLRIGEIEATWLPAAHILGAAMVHLSTPAGCVLFTGDWSVSTQRTVPALARPSEHVDILVTEATYGNRLHEDRRAAETRLVERIARTVQHGGRVLIPAFAIGRAQELLRILRRAARDGRLPAVPVYVDGLVRAVCEVYRRHPTWLTRDLSRDLRSGHPFYDDRIRPVETPEDRRAVMEGGPCVVVASSGMLAGGASVAYARAFATRAEDAILFTGYQDEESPGRALLDLADGSGPRQLAIGGGPVDVRCDVERYGLSAHADRMQMVGLIDGLAPRTVVLVHADREAKLALSRSISCRDVVCAEDGNVVRRGFPVRRAARPQERPEISSDEARRLLGPQTDAPVRARDVAEAWYGEPPSPAGAERFADRLISLGLVRRDDERPQILWLLPTAEAALPAHEVALDESLKQENPKGRLLEYCMRRRIDPPETEYGTDGAFHTASLTLTTGAARLHSGTQRAASRRATEQLAAHALLHKLRSHDGDAVVVSDEQAAALRAANPKGRLLEWCARTRAAQPLFEGRAAAGGYKVRAVWPPRAEAPTTSAWYMAPAKKAAEQAAAAELLAALEALEAEPPSPSPRSAPAADARGRLNELRQARAIDDFGYEVIGAGGPAHAPLFVMQAWAIARGVGRIIGEPVECSSKKMGEREAAGSLLAALATGGVAEQPDRRGSDA